MADLPHAVVTIAKQNTVAAELSGGRVFWGEIPQGTPRPSARLSTASNLPLEDLEGAALPRRVRLQADCFGFRHSEAWNLAEALVEAFREPATAAGLSVSCFGSEGPNDRRGGDTPSGFVHFVQVDLGLWVARTVNGSI